MACEICGRWNCMRSFHSLKAQEDFDNKTGQFAPDDEDEDENKEAADGQT